MVMFCLVIYNNVLLYLTITMFYWVITIMFCCVTVTMFESPTLKDQSVDGPNVERRIRGQEVCRKGMNNEGHNVEWNICSIVTSKGCMSKVLYIGLDTMSKILYI
jgi:hypothetical protein